MGEPRLITARIAPRFDREDIFYAKLTVRDHVCSVVQCNGAFAGQVPPRSLKTFGSEKSQVTCDQEVAVHPPMIKWTAQ